MAFHDLLFAAQLHAPLDMVYPVRPPRDFDGSGDVGAGAGRFRTVLRDLVSVLLGGIAGRAGHS